MAVPVFALQITDELLHVVHIVVEVEFTFAQWDQAGVLPVRDVDLVVFEHGFDGVAQQGGVVARQRRHDQHHRLCFEFGQRGGIVGEALKAAQLAKWLIHLDALVDGNFGTFNFNGLDAKGWLLIVFAQTV